MPLYRRLALEAQRESKQPVDVAVLSIEPPAVVKRHLADYHVAIDNVYQVSSKTGLRYTPTLLIADKNGVIQRVYEGLLDDTREQELLNTIRSFHAAL